MTQRKVIDGRTYRVTQKGWNEPRLWILNDSGVWVELSAAVYPLIMRAFGVVNLDALGV